MNQAPGKFKQTIFAFSQDRKWSPDNVRLNTQDNKNAGPMKMSNYDNC